MNEDEADQGSGLDTKYRIDSAQGESARLHLHLLRVAAMLTTHSLQQDRHHRTQVHTRRRRSSSPVQDIT